jgi:uncharacterized membrane protein
MKKMIIRGIGILLIVMGVPKAFACLRAVLFVIPIGAEAGLPSAAVWSATILNLAMAAIGIGKIVGGFGLLWPKYWAKWTAAAAAAMHVLLLTYFGAPIWIQMVHGNFRNSANIPMWKDYVTIGVNIAIVVLLLSLFKKAKEATGTTKPRNATSEPAPSAGSEAVQG